MLSVSSASRPSTRGAAIHAKILAAARTLFVEHGYDDVSMERIAEAAGVSRRTVYNKFVDKGDIYRAVFEPAVERLEAIVRTEIAPADDPREMLYRYTSVMVGLLHHPDEIDLLRVLVLDADRQPWLARAFVDRVRAPMRAAFRAELQRLVAAGKLPANDEAVQCEQFFATTLGLLAFPQLLKFEPEEMGMRLDDVLRSAVDSLLVAWKAAA